MFDTDANIVEAIGSIGQVFGVDIDLATAQRVVFSNIDKSAWGEWFPADFTPRVWGERYRG